MRRLIATLPGVAAAVMLVGCAGRQTKPVGQTLTVFLSRAEPATLCRMASAVNAARQAGPALWIVPAGAFEPGPATDLTDGEGAVRLLNAAGVDAVLLTPDWLDFGLTRLTQLVDMARFYVLSANVLDSTGRPLCHQFMVRRHEDIEVGLTGLWRDSLGRAQQAGGVRLAEPSFAAARTEALMRQRAGIVGALVAGPDSAPVWGFDFLAGAPSSGTVGLALAGAAARYDLRINDGVIVSAVPVRVEPEQMMPDSAVQAVSDSIDRAVEAFGGMTVTGQRGRMSADELTSSVVKGHLTSKQVDAWLYDSPLFRTGWDGAAIARRDLVTLLVEPQRPLLFELTEGELKLLSRGRGLTLQLGPGMVADRLSATRRYRVAVTRGFLARHPMPSARSLAFSPQPLWTIAADVLESWSSRR